MSVQLERAADLLFPNGDSRVGNVKFFRGTRCDVTADQLGDQLLQARSQVESGAAQRVDNIDRGMRA